jgi:predicted metal-dependent phosphoesterase TrpH
MKTDLHVHTSTGSDGAWTVEQVLAEAKRRGIGLLAVTDHDSLAAQERAAALARGYGIRYLTGIELNVTFENPLRPGKTVSLDFLGYGYDPANGALRDKLETLREKRESRARQILDNLNTEFRKDGIPLLTGEDMRKIEETVDGAFGRPHIARYLVGKGIVTDVQEAFDRYLVRCDVAKFPLSLAEASALIRGAGGVLVLAHPDDPHGTSLVSVTEDLSVQTDIVERHMLGAIDGVECWHSR